MMRLFLLVITIAISVTTIAQAPANDECVNAIPLTVSSSGACNNNFSTNSLNATQSMAPCVGATANDVWFSFTATKTEQAIMLTKGSIQNPIMEVFSGTCGSLISLGCFNDLSVGAGVEYRRKINGLTIGATYYIRIYGNTTAGSFSLCIFEPGANDDCANAINIPINTGLQWTTTVTSNNLNNSNSGIGCANVNKADGWFQFVADDSVHVLYVSGPAVTAFEQNTRVQVFDGTCGSLTALNLYNKQGTAFDCWQVAVSDGYKTIRGLTPGNTYYISIIQDMSLAINKTSNFDIAISHVPANDGITGAEPVTVNAGTIITSTATGNFRNATPTPGISDNGCFSTQDVDIWYKFTATSNHHNILATFIGTNADPDVIIYTLNSGNLTPVVCLSGGDNEHRYADFTTFTPATEYYIRAKARVSDFNDHLFSLTITTPPATHLNENCASAETLPFDDKILSSSRGAVLSATSGACNFHSASDFANDLWYTFTSPKDATAVLTFTIPNEAPFDASINAGVEIFTGNCGALTPVDCAHMNISNGITAYNKNFTFFPTTGSTYFIRVFTFNGVITPFALSFSQFSGLPVTITSFKATQTPQGSVKLIWNTEEESGINYYDVERSPNGIQFDQLTRVIARNNSAPSQYAADDASPLSGVSFYRLKIVNQDGKVEYSKTVKMDIGNGVTGNLKISRRGNSIIINNRGTTIENIGINIFTATGQKIYSSTKRIAAGANEILLPGRTGQPLLVQIIKEDNTTKTFKIF